MSNVQDEIVKALTESVDWGYYDKFSDLLHTYMPDEGEGETKASQTATAINKLIYKWYNDGDVFDNSYYLEGWANDLSSYANWLYNNVEAAAPILDKIKECKTDDDYEALLKELADEFLVEEILKEFAQEAKVDSIYECSGPFEFVDQEEEEEEWPEEDYDDFEEDEEEE